MIQLDKSTDHKSQLQLAVDKSTMDLLHKDIPLPNGTHIYVLHMDGMGRMPQEVMSILSEVDRETVVANIINIRGDKLFTIVYKRNRTVITYDISLNTVTIESSHWEDLFKNELLYGFFNVINSHKDNMKLVSENNVPRNWWKNNTDDSSQAPIVKNKQNKDFMTKLIVATMDDLGVTAEDISKIRVSSEYDSLRNKYAHLVEELIKFK